jgi:hypothetical protein
MVFSVQYWPPGSLHQASVGERGGGEDRARPLSSRRWCRDRIRDSSCHLWRRQMLKEQRNHSDC